MKNLCLIIFISSFVFSGCSHKKNTNPFKSAVSPVKDGAAQTVSEADKAKKAKADAEAAAAAEALKAKQEAERKAIEDNKERAAELDLKARTASNGSIMLADSCIKVPQIEILNTEVMKYANETAAKYNKTVIAYFNDIVEKKSDALVDFLKVVDAQIEKFNSSTNSKLKLNPACPVLGVKKKDDLASLQVEVQIKMSKDKDGKEQNNFIGLDILSNAKDGTNGTRFCLPSCIDGDNDSKASFGIVPYNR